VSARVELPNAALLLKEMRDAGVLINAAGAGEAEVLAAIDRLAASVVAFVTWWPRLDEATRRAVAELVVEAGYKCASDAQGERFVAMLTPTALQAAGAGGSAGVLGADLIWPEAGRLGLLARLLRERELPGGVLRRVEGAVRAAAGGARPGAAFDAGAEAALRLMPLKIVSGEAPLGPGERATVARAATLAADRWLVAAGGATGGQSVERAQRAQLLLALDAVETVLISGPELNDHPGAFNFVQGVLAKLRYREADASRGRVLAWLADERVSIGDASAVMQMLAALGSSTGVDATMTFTLGATPLDRDNARSTLASAWAIAAPASGGGLAADWLTAARVALNQATTAAIDTEHFASAATLARVARAAAHRQRGEPVPAELLDTEAASGRFAGAQAASIDPKALHRASEDDGQWTLRFLVESKTVAARVARLDELGGVHEIGPVDAGALAEAALGAALEVRLAAQSAALRYAHRPSMINAVLDVLPRAPRGARNIGFLSQMAGVGLLSHTSPGYMLHYRRGLVERLLFETASASPALSIDDSALLIAEAYSMTAGRPLPGMQSPRAGLLAAQSAELLTRTLREEVTGLLPGAALVISPVEIDQRQRGRVLVSAGLVQRFVAHQAAAAELLAVLAARERPTRVEEVLSVIATMNQARGRAKSAGEQVRVTQEAIVRLWAVRLGEQL